jgi:signal transduction histidine kinase
MGMSDVDDEVRRLRSHVAAVEQLLEVHERTTIEQSRRLEDALAEAGALAAERERLIAELDRERSRLKDIFMQAPAVIAMLRGPEHVFEMANPPYYQLAGRRDILGKPVAEALPEVVGQGFIELLDGVYRTGEPFVGNEIRVLLRTEADAPLVERYVNFVYQPVTGVGGAVTGIFVHGVDVTAGVHARYLLEEQATELELQTAELQVQATHLEETQLELEMANDELQRVNADLAARSEEAERARSEIEGLIDSRSRFYAQMSHELRTPMNAVLGYNDLLLAGVYGPLSDTQTRGIERSQKAARHLLELVNDILDLSKIEAGKLELQMEEVCIRSLIDDLFTTLRPMAEEHDSTLEITDEVCPRAILTDPRRVRQIFLNLFSNAIKFGKGKPVTVRCGAAPDGSVAVEVTDQGVGIAAEDLALVFEEFVQIGTGDRHGTGLGLPISRHLAEILGGSLGVTSAPGEGSTFRLVLPSAPR